MYRKSRRKCRNCKDQFQPDYRNRKRQKFCSKPECKKASRAETQRRWRRKPENRDYYIERVRAWREANPGYWRRKVALQDICTVERSENKEETAVITAQNPENITPLQDTWILQHPFMVGFLANLTGHTLLDDIARSASHLIQLGLDILSEQPNTNGGKYAHQTDHPP